MHEVAHEGIHYFTHADKGIFTLIRDLAVKGGIVAKEYIEGRRKKHFPPLNFFLIIAAVNLLAINLDGAIEIKPIQEMIPNISTVTDANQLEFYHNFYARYVKAMELIGKYSNITAILSLPIITWVFFLFYKRSGYNYVEHLFAGMYMYGFALLSFALLASLNYFLRFDPNIVYFVCIVFQLAYSIMFYRQLQPTFSKRRAVVATICAYGLAFSFWGILVFLYTIGLFGG